MSIAGSEGGGNSTATFGDSPEKAEEGNIAEVGEIMDADMSSPNPALTDATPSSRAAASSDSDGFVHVTQRAPIRGPAGMSPVPDQSPPASRSPYENTGAARRRAVTPRTGTGPRTPRSLPPARYISSTSTVRGDVENWQHGGTEVEEHRHHPRNVILLRHS